MVFILREECLQIGGELSAAPNLPHLLGPLMEHRGYGRTKLKLGIQRIIGNFPDTEEEGHCLARTMAVKTMNYTTVVRCL